MICLIDGNNFFVSCEKVFDPTLHKQPVIVLSNNDGCIISRSNEAKALGIKMGQPLFQIKDLIEEKKVKVFSSNFTLYGDMSDRMMHVIRECSPKVEVYSIDEAFCHLDLKHTPDLKEYGWEIKNKIKQYTGIPCGIGMSHTKVLAKIANNIAKKSPKANGVLALVEDKHIDYALERTRVEEIWGISRRSQKFLNSHNIYTAKEFREASPTFIKKNMSIVGLRIQKELRKENCLNLKEIDPPKKSIIVSRSFSKYAKSYYDLLGPLTHFVTSGCAKLRAQKSEASAVGVFLQTNRFSKYIPQYHPSIIVKLDYYTSSDFHILKGAIEGLNKIYKDGYEYKKCGIFLTQLNTESDEPRTLFDTRDISKERILFHTFDQIRDKFGHRAILLANAMDYSWKPSCTLKSREFSTNLLESLIV